MKFSYVPDYGLRNLYSLLFSIGFLEKFHQLNKIFESSNLQNNGS